MAVVQPRPTHILYQCAKCGDDRTSFNVAHLKNWTDNNNITTRASSHEKISKFSILMG